MARKGILSTDSTAPAAATTPRKNETSARMMPRGAVGALQSSLSKLQENAVQEIDPALIDDAGIEDRLGIDDEAQARLIESLRTYGQQVPVLLRPHARTAGRYEIVYGRRRLSALRAIGVPVKAMVRQLDDEALVLAQGQENTARQDLSFIEKAAFSAQLQTAGYDRQTIAAALSIDLPMVSRMLKVGTAFDMAFLRLIGSAPGIGRERWLALVKALETDPQARSRAQAQAEEASAAGLTSDERFEAVYDRAMNRPTSSKRPPAPAKDRDMTAGDGTQLARIRSTARGLTLTIPAKGTAGFDAWLDAHAEEILADLHARFQNGSGED